MPAIKKCLNLLQNLGNPIAVTRRYCDQSQVIRPEKPFLQCGQRDEYLVIGTHSGSETGAVALRGENADDLLRGRAEF